MFLSSATSYNYIKNNFVCLFVYLIEYNNAVLRFTEIYERTVSDIENSNDERFIERIVYDFERYCSDMMNLATKIFRYLDSLHLQYLKILDSYVVNIRNAMRLRIDHTHQNVQNCLPPEISSNKGPFFKNFIN